MGNRIQKIISEHGLASRRAAEKLIEQGKVTVNGRTAVLGDTAEESDEILVDGKPLQKDINKVYLMLNKPRGYVTTASDEKGRKTVLDLVKDCPERVYPVGRLDLNSRGLLLLTNDGTFTQKLSHPSNNKTKKYIVTVKENPTKYIESLNNQMEIDGYLINPVKVRLIRNNGDNSQLEFILTEGRNRQIRKMCEKCNLTVTDLFRTEYAGLSLGRLKSGEWRYLTNNELSFLEESGCL